MGKVTDWLNGAQSLTDIEHKRRAEAALKLKVDTEIAHRAQAAIAIGTSTAAQLRTLETQGLTLTPAQMVERLESMMTALSESVSAVRA